MASDVYPQLISVRDLSLEDIPHIVRYWFHSPTGFVEGMGVDPNKLPSESEFEKGLQEKLETNKLLSVSKLNALAILYEGKAIGFHTINPLIEGDHGIFHAHIWAPEMRRKGVALFSYVKACHFFMKRFGLKRILFKTPVQNVGPIRVKEKLGIRCIGEETVGFGIIRDGTLAKVFELTNEEAQLLNKKIAAYDVDLSQMQRNLSLSAEERLIEHQNSLNLTLELQRAGQKLREQPQ